MIPTKIAVVTVSCRVGQTTFDDSARTWRMNSPGLVLGLAARSSIVKIPYRLPPRGQRRPGAWKATGRGSVFSDVGRTRRL
jgi:hypothetical protein